LSVDERGVRLLGIDDRYQLFVLLITGLGNHRYLSDAAVLRSQDGLKRFLSDQGTR
jgi:hypothetical protein